jgi:hypothetical protein
MTKPIKPRPKWLGAGVRAGEESKPEPVQRDAPSAGVGADETTALVDSRGPLEPWMCGAKLRGERAGLRCRSPKMKGSSRCRMHGSASRNAREKARERILMASDYAAKRLIQFMNSDAVPYNVRLSAAKDLLDRADLAGTSKVEVEMPGFMETLERAVKVRRLAPDPDDSPDDTPRVERGSIVDAEVVEDDEPPAIETKPKPAPRPIETDTMNAPGRNQHAHADLYSGEPPAGSAAAVRRASRTRSRPTEIRR